MSPTILKIILNSTSAITLVNNQTISSLIILINSLNNPFIIS